MILYRLLVNLFVLFVSLLSPYNQFELVQGDFTDPEQVQRITEANVVFTNNYIFGPDLNQTLRVSHSSFSLPYPLSLIYSLQSTSSPIVSFSFFPLADRISFVFLIYIFLTLTWDYAFNIHMQKLK